MTIQKGMTEMTITEKVAHLKGLAEGMEISADTKEGKLLLAIIDVLDDVSLAIEDIDNYTEELAAQVDEIDADLADLEDECYGDDDCDCCDCDCEDDMYDVCCPNCEEEFSVDEETLLDGCVECPNCGEHLEFDIDCCDDDCDCGCCDCEDEE